jgi:transposase
MSKDALLIAIDSVPSPVAKVDVTSPVRLQQPDRHQLNMDMRSLDQKIAPDHPVRAVWALVQALDLSKFYEPIRARGSAPGRPMTDPRIMVALWLWASVCGIGRSRELARRCESDNTYLWILGTVTTNYHTLGEFRNGHGKALDDLLTQVIVALVDKQLVDVERISQDGTRVRAFAGVSSFRGQERLEELHKQAQKHVEVLKSQVHDPLSMTREEAAQERAAREHQARIQEAINQLPAIERARKNSNNTKAVAKRKSRASTTDPDARIMRMADGGFRPAYNVQIAADTQSRAIVGVSVVQTGSDNAQADPMRKQVEERTGLKVKEQLVDGGYLSLDQIENAEDVDMYVPLRPPKEGQEPKKPDPKEPQIVQDWRNRMASEEGKEIYKQRASTVETINGELKCNRGLMQFSVRGIEKVLCATLWSVLAYNFVHFTPQLLSG